MDQEFQYVERDFSTWKQEDLEDYARVAPRLPVREESVTQTGPGEFHSDVAISATHDVTIFRPRVKVPSIGVTVLDPAYIGFAIPVSWSGECVINGEAANSTTIYLPVDGSCVYVRGDSRDILGVILRRDRFHETLAALSGVDTHRAFVDCQKLVLTPAAAGLLCSQLTAILDEGAAKQTRFALANFYDDVSALIADACLSALPSPEPTQSRFRIATHIVRKAEDRFVEAKGVRLSLADLCAAAGVGKSTLYSAFHSVYGMAPLDYFHKRRLTEARSTLLNSAQRRGGVKLAALNVGLTELGRFAVEYRRLFGESPSFTLNRSPN